MKNIYLFLNYFFLIFHTGFTLFNLTGWIFKKTRKIHLLTMLLTSFSWFVLGIFYGWGYCVCTDWHWLIRQKLGYHDTSISYIHFLLLQITGINFYEPLVIKGTVISFFICLILTLILNIHDLIKVYYIRS